MKYLIYILTLVFLLPSCKKETDELFDKSADERIQEALDRYESALLQRLRLEIICISERSGEREYRSGGTDLLFNFPDSNRVIMVSDFTADMAAVPKESGFRLKATQRPSLIFDTYSYIHVAADPDENVSFSPAQAGGFGWGTDFDFSFTELNPGDTIRLKGNFNGSDALLIKATAEEIAEAFDGTMSGIIQATADYSSSNPFLYFPASIIQKLAYRLIYFYTGLIFLI